MLALIGLHRFNSGFEPPQEFFSEFCCGCCQENGLEVALLDLAAWDSAPLARVELGVASGQIRVGSTSPSALGGHTGR